MLTASGPFLTMKTSPGEGVLAGFVGFALLGLILSSVCALKWNEVSPPPQSRVAENGATATQPNIAAGYNAVGDGNTTRPLGMALLGVRPDKDLGAVAGSEVLVRTAGAQAGGATATVVAILTAAED